MSFSKKVAFHTLGCKVNQYETESIKNQLIKRGYEEVPFEDKSDIYIINSCTVTSIAVKHKVTFHSLGNFVFELPKL